LSKIRGALHYWNLLIGAILSRFGHTNLLVTELMTKPSWHFDFAEDG
jgi:hypothetical protein